MTIPKLIVTIDTEGDNQWDYQSRKQVNLDNIKKIPYLQKLFDKYNVRPVYLVSYPVARDAESTGIIKQILKDKKCEVGGHFHPWSTPPIKEEHVRDTTPPHHLGTEEVKEKLKLLTKTIEDTFQLKPISYRAGRWGFDNRSVGILEELGYLVDSSITPLVSWEHVGGLDFRRAPRLPYYLDYDDVCSEGKSKVLEVPVSINFSKKAREFFKEYYFASRGHTLPYQILSKLNLLKILWLRPSVSSLPEMMQLVDSLVAEGVPVLTMMFHSSDMILDGNPNYQKEKHIQDFFKRLEGILDYLRNSKKLKSLTFAEYRMQS